MNSDSAPRLINADDLIGHQGTTSYQQWSYSASNKAVHKFRNAIFPYASGLGRPSQGLVIHQTRIMEKHSEASLALREAEELQEQAVLAENSREEREGLILTLEFLTLKGERALPETKQDGEICPGKLGKNYRQQCPEGRRRGQEQKPESHC